MKKQTVIASFLVLFMPLLILAQDSTARKGYYIGAVFSPDYSYRILSPGHGMIDPLIVQQRNASEIPKLSFTAGVNLLHQRNKKIAYSLGIQFSIKGEAGNFVPVMFSNGTTERVSFSYNTTYLDLPFKFDYYICTGRNAWYVTGGISPNIFLYEQVIDVVKADNGSEQRSSTIYGINRANYNLINPQVQLGFGFDRQINSSRLRIEPIYRMSVWNVHDAGTVKGYFYSIGINCSYLFSLKK
jgi:hypothetical protein